MEDARHDKDLDDPTVINIQAALTPFQYSSVSDTNNKEATGPSVAGI